MFLGGKGGRCVGQTPYHFHVPIVLKSGRLKLPDPSRPVQACNGIALPLNFYYCRLVTTHLQLTNISILLLASCQQTCMTYTIAVCTVEHS
jgi:hypothetical protein